MRALDREAERVARAARLTALGFQRLDDSGHVAREVKRLRVGQEGREEADAARDAEMTG